MISSFSRFDNARPRHESKSHLPTGLWKVAKTKLTTSDISVKRVLERIVVADRLCTCAAKSPIGDDAHRGQNRGKVQSGDTSSQTTETFMPALMSSCSTSRRLLVIIAPPQSSSLTTTVLYGTASSVAGMHGAVHDCPGIDLTDALGLHPAKAERPAVVAERHGREPKVPTIAALLDNEAVVLARIPELLGIPVGQWSWHRGPEQVQSSISTALLLFSYGGRGRLKAWPKAPRSPDTSRRRRLEKSTYRASAAHLREGC